MEWNVYAVVILVALLVDHGVRLLADALNLGALAPVPPEGLRHVYDEDRYRRSQLYLRDRTRLGIVSSSTRLAALLAFWLGGGFAWLDGWARSAADGPVLAGLLFVGALVLGQAAVALPFRAWSVFVVEERWGFNRTTPRTFVADTGRGLLLAALLGGALLAAVLALFERIGPGAWLPCWLVVAAFVLLAQLVAPRWLLPLFHRFRPLAEGELSRRIRAYAARVGFPLEGLFVIDGSRRSSKANAFFTGFGRHRRIALFDTLLERHGDDEVLAVVAHEVGHDKLRHVQIGLLAGIAHAGVVLALFPIAYGPELLAAFGVTAPSYHAGLVFYALLLTPLELPLSIALNALSRRHEHAADRWAVETTDLAAPLARALERLAADSLGNLTPHPLEVALHHSHPPLPRRLAAIDAVAADRARRPAPA